MVTHRIARSLNESTELSITLGTKWEKWIVNWSIACLYIFDRQICFGERRFNLSEATVRLIKWDVCLKRLDECVEGRGCSMVVVWKRRQTRGCVMSDTDRVPRYRIHEASSSLQIFQHVENWLAALVSIYNYQKWVNVAQRMYCALEI